MYKVSFKFIHQFIYYDTLCQTRFPEIIIIILLKKEQVWYTWKDCKNDSKLKRDIHLTIKLSTFQLILFQDQFHVRFFERNSNIINKTHY